MTLTSNLNIGVNVKLVGTSDGGFEKKKLVLVKGLDILVLVLVMCSKGLGLTQSNLPRPPGPQKF